MLGDRGHDVDSEPVSLGKIDSLELHPQFQATREHYAELYARPGAMHSAFAQFRSLRQDAEDNVTSMVTKLTMPVLAVGGEKSFGASEAAVMRNAATNVTELVIPNSGHWLMEEQPTATIAAVRAFLSPR
jgi:pimeloyl-ACP methyl ester carboxylesterase